MHVSALEEYALRCALRLAALGDQAHISASAVAEKEGISVQYASKILHLFRKEGLVRATRGMQGGFRLSRPAERISVRDVFLVLKGERGVICEYFRGQQRECVHIHDCAMRPVWQVLVGYFENVLEKLSLADLLRSEEESRKKVELFARDEADRIHRNLGKTT
ncbi:MAG: Rrf2 family transcriptional regulator [Bdellovibrionales bacterium]|nr:Rrf2 family transcriptional regulator [Bdellovibrionales bacterium]